MPRLSPRSGRVRGRARLPTLVFGNVDRRYVQCQSRPRAGAHDRLVAFARPSPCAAFALAVEATAGAVVAVNEFGVLAAGAENATRINGVPEDRMRVGRKSHASPLETDSCFHRSDIGGSRHRRPHSGPGSARSSPSPTTKRCWRRDRSSMRPSMPGVRRERRPTGRVLAQHEDAKQGLRPGGRRPSR